MIYKAYSSDSNLLLSLPETGMGYQIIEGQLTGSFSTKRYFVYNSDLIVDFDSEFQRFKQQIISRGYSTILMNLTCLILKLIRLDLFQEVIYMKVDI